MNTYYFIPLQRFTQYLASSNSTFQLSNFLDKSGVQGECHQHVYYLQPNLIPIIKIYNVANKITKRMSLGDSTCDFSFSGTSKIRYTGVKI